MSNSNVLQKDLKSIYTISLISTDDAGIDAHAQLKQSMVELKIDNLIKTIYILVDTEILMSKIRMNLG